jgi:predicted  nucleic acid-binding Zn ribbon protein
MALSWPSSVRVSGPISHGSSPIDTEKIKVVRARYDDPSRAADKGKWAEEWDVCVCGIMNGIIMDTYRYCWCRDSRLHEAGPVETRDLGPDG